MEQWSNNTTKFDLVLVSTQTMFMHKGSLNINMDTEILYIRRTLLKDSWEKLLSLTPGKDILLINDNKDSAVESISLLYELGARHIKFIPAYPGMKNVPNVSEAVTPGEQNEITENVKSLINIKERVIDTSTIVDILSRFDLLNSELRKKMKDYSDKIVPRSIGLQTTMQNLMDNTDYLTQTLNNVQDGVVAFDASNKITIFNKVAEHLFQQNSWDLIGRKIDYLLSTVSKDFTNLNDIKHKVCFINKQKVIMNAVFLQGDNSKDLGGIITFKIAKEVEELEIKLRLKIKERGHVAKYKFTDIISKSNKIEKLKGLANKMSRSDSNILIIGESGTGKELFAHSIHNYSSRNLFPFVAVNCSALPENLLESELFGYDEGAFTGAKKGGKQGLFEQAHKGTIFLDEIGDISPNMQSRLLRVLQQKEVLRVGGTKVIPVDVRVVAATNKNLFQLVQEGKFRDDLYYRLKVLQLDIPPLRDRIEDIWPLTNHFMLKRGASLIFSSEAKHYFETYNWPGNIRELENVIEYLSIMSNGEIDKKDLPFSNLSLEEVKKEEENDKGLRRLSKQDIKQFLLILIYEMNQYGLSAGRRSLLKEARDNGISISEMGIRKELKILEEEGYISIGKGRSGCSLTNKGIEVAQL